MKRSQTSVPLAAAAFLAIALAGGAEASEATSGADASPTPTTSQGQGGSGTMIGSLAGMHGEVPAGWYYLPVTMRGSNPYAPSEGAPLRAVVQVPAGFATEDGTTLHSVGATGAADSLGLATDVWMVDTQPCGGGRLVDPGPTVEDLTQALAPHATQAPQPVTLDGAEGYYLQVATPEDLTQCAGGIFRLTDDRAERTPGTDHLWVLNVDGERVVVTVRTPSGSSGESDQTVQMAESLLLEHRHAPH